MKKVLIVITAVMIFFSSVFMPVRKAEAAAPAALAAGGGVGYTAAGVYTITGLLVAGGAGALGYDHADEIKTHALGVWEKTNDIAKQAFIDSVDASIAMGKSTVALSQDIIDGFKEAGLASWDWLSSLFATDHVENAVSGGMESWLAYNSGTRYIYEIPSSLRTEYKFRIVKPDGTTKDFNSFGIEKEYSYSRVYVMGSYSEAWGSFSSGLGKGFPYQFFSSYSDIYSLVTSFGYSVTLVANNLDLPTTEALNEGLATSLDGLANGTKEINLSLDNWLATTPEGQALQFDADAGTMVLDGVPYAGEFDWTYPPIGVSDSYNPTIDNPSVPLDGVVSGDIPISGTSEGTGVGEGEIAGEYGGVLGRIESILNSIGAGIGTVVTTITTGIVGSPENVNWDKLKLAGGTFTTQFPFSLPWDISRGLNAIFGGFSEDGNIPKWDWEFSVFGEKQTWTIGFPDLIVSWMPFIKGVLLIVFDIGLIYAVRKLLGGAS